MEKKIGNIYSGFELLEIRELADIKSEGYLFEHKKTGAKLLYLANDDDNKVFYAGFRTPPENSKGVQHIIEHSLLCGSRKYKAKEPFVELLKGSLNTYLNASTYSDRTVYPVASHNDKDFKNLVDVYLDAVFFPMIYERPEIFYQEGWHYSYDEKEDTLSYNGVVYNEMKGAYSSKDDVFYDKIIESLYPDTQYKNDSGGNPENIPELSYEEFLDFHKKYYNPSNSFLYLYGDMNIDEYLKYIDEEYLSKFERIEIDSTVKEQKPLEKQIEAEEVYSISQEESMENKAGLAMGFAIGDILDPQLKIDFKILEKILVGTSASPLRNALNDADIAQSIESYYLAETVSMFMILAENTELDKKEKFKNVIYNTLEDIVKNGLNKKLVQGAVNNYEFSLREADYGYKPKGLAYGLTAMIGWTHNADPMLFMDYGKYIENIRANIDNNYFEKLIEKYLINNKHSVLAVLKPQRGLEAQREKKLKEKLAMIRQNMSDEEIGKIKEIEKRLEEFHNTPDSQEVLEQIPILKIEDIDKKAKKLPIRIVEKDNYKILFHEMDTNKIMYLNLAFDLTVIPQEKLQYLSILGLLLGRLSTKNYSYIDFSNEMRLYSNGLGKSLESFADKNDKFYPKFELKVKMLSHNLPKVLELLVEVMNNTLFTEFKRIKDIILETKVEMTSSMLYSGDYTSLLRAMSNISQSAKFEDLTSGISFYEFLCDLEDRFDNDKEQIIKEFEDIYYKLFNKNNLLVSIGLEKEEVEFFEKEFKYVEEKLKTDELPVFDYKFEYKEKKEAFTSSSQVQYVSKVVNYKKIGYEYNGNMLVLKNIMDMDYLWNKVRVQGGAYGASAGFTKNGLLYFASYRDPNITKTLDAYDNVSEYLKNAEINEREMRKYIIGTINSADADKSNASKCWTAMARYIINVSQEEIQKERDELLSTTAEKIKGYYKLLEEIVKQQNIAVVGNESLIKKNEPMFDSINTIFQK